MKRLFVGIALNDAARENVAAVQDRLREVATRQGVRFVRPEKLHLTLVFLGDAEPEGVMAACAEVCARHAPTELFSTTLGGFPDLRRPKVVWLGVEGGIDALSALQADLAAALGQSTAEYIPHLTLARVSPGSKAVGYAAQTLELDLPPAKIEVEEVSLFESNPDGRYEILASWPVASSSRQ